MEALEPLSGEHRRPNHRRPRGGAGGRGHQQHRAAGFSGGAATLEAGGGGFASSFDLFGGAEALDELWVFPARCPCASVCVGVFLHVCVCVLACVCVRTFAGSRVRVYGGLMKWVTQQEQPCVRP
jgi:hypothetical protein